MHRRDRDDEQEVLNGIAEAPESAPVERERDLERERGGRVEDDGGEDDQGV